MAVKFNGGDELVNAVKSFISENASAVVEAIFQSELGERFAERVAEGKTEAPQPVKPSVPEPGVGSVVYFTNVSPSDGIKRFYTAVRSPKGWASTSGTSRLSRTPDWTEIVEFAGDSLQVVRDGSLAEAA